MCLSSQVLSLFSSETTGNLQQNLLVHHLVIEALVTFYIFLVMKKNKFLHLLLFVLRFYLGFLSVPSLKAYINYMAMLLAIFFIPHSLSSFIDQ